MYRGLLLKPYNRYVEFRAGDNVQVANGDAASTESTVNPGTTVHRALVLGGQAMAIAWGNAAKNGKSQFSSTTKKVDHDNAEEHSIAWMNGAKKLRFKDRDGYMEDHGIIAVDTAVSARS